MVQGLLFCYIHWWRVILSLYVWRYSQLDIFTISNSDSLVIFSVCMWLLLRHFNIISLGLLLCNIQILVLPLFDRFLVKQFLFFIKNVNKLIHIKVVGPIVSHLAIWSRMLSTYLKLCQRFSNGLIWCPWVDQHIIVYHQLLDYVLTHHLFII